MAEKTRKADLSIYLAKSEVETASQILKNPEQLKSFDLKVDGINPCTLYVKKSHQNPPPWAKFFEQIRCQSTIVSNIRNNCALTPNLPINLTPINYCDTY